MSRIETDQHSWDDVSHHGGPLYQCEYCGVYRFTLKGPPYPPCPKASQVLIRRRLEQEQKERGEYERMLAERRRFDELHEKYGKK